jgi:hypothetical protein
LQIPILVSLIGTVGRYSLSLFIEAKATNARQLQAVLGTPRHLRATETRSIRNQLKCAYMYHHNSSSCMMMLQLEECCIFEIKMHEPTSQGFWLGCRWPNPCTTIAASLNNPYESVGITAIYS